MAEVVVGVGIQPPSILLCLCPREPLVVVLMESLEDHLQDRDIMDLDHMHTLNTVVYTATTTVNILTTRRLETEAAARLDNNIRVDSVAATGRASTEVVLEEE